MHTGAGRIVNLRMRPLSLVERSLETPTVSLAALMSGDGTGDVGGSTPVTLDQYVDEILRSGLPGVRDLPAVAREAQLDAYLEQTVRREPAAPRARSARILADWLRTYAAAVSTTTSYDAITGAAARGDGPRPRFPPPAGTATCWRRCGSSSRCPAGARRRTNSRGPPRGTSTSCATPPWRRVSSASGPPV